MEVNQIIINKAYKFRIYPNQAQAIPEDLMKHL
ncbi:helix-turn-helix domain-containing protein [Bacillus thuringiensis]